MFISVTFPVADFRDLHSECAGRLGRPSWGSADPQATFARGFGAICTRTKSGNGFVGENYYADANNLLKYPGQLFIEPFKSYRRKVLCYPVYRRFYFDGKIAGRFEFGFRLNEATINQIHMDRPSAEYSIIEISKQILTRQVAVHLLDNRKIGCEFFKAMVPLRDGYIMSSTEVDKLKMYDIDSVGSSYVGVGSPFVFIRSSAITPIVSGKQQRVLFDRDETVLLVTRSGVHKQSFDTAVLSSQAPLNAELPHERLARLFYSQVRALTYAHSFFLKQVDNGKISGLSRLQPAIEALISRIKNLSPVEGSADDRSTCEALRELLENADINTATLANEIESRLRPSGWRRVLSPLWRYLDKKAEIAIEAAASTATKHVLTGGL